jgi:uncharacterized protein YkwD
MKRTLVLALLVACGPTTKSSGAGSTTTDPDDTATEGVAGDDEADPAAPTGAGDAADVILAETNRYRADHCAAPLTWSTKLAAAAQDWADQLKDAGCAFEHSQLAYGENLAGGTTGYLPPEAVVEMWYREVDAYDFAKGGFSMDTGHFTQLVWRSTTQVGCGMSQCNGQDIWVCEYDPPGNMEGDFRSQVQPTSCR